MDKEILTIRTSPFMPYHSFVLNRLLAVLFFYPFLHLYSPFLIVFPPIFSPYTSFFLRFRAQKIYFFLLRLYFFFFSFCFFFVLCFILDFPARLKGDLPIPFSNFQSATFKVRVTSNFPFFFSFCFKALVPLL